MSSEQAAIEPIVRNHVVLSGRVTLLPEERQLPSGDLIVSTRIVVDREPTRARNGQSRSRQRVDTIDCVAWSAQLRRSVRRWEVGNQVYVEGALRRRFFRTERGLTSKVEIELLTARVLSRSTSSGRRADRVPQPAPG